MNEEYDVYGNFSVTTVRKIGKENWEKKPSPAIMEIALMGESNASQSQPEKDRWYWYSILSSMKGGCDEC